MRQNIMVVVMVIAIAATGFVWYRYIRTPSVPDVTVIPESVGAESSAVIQGYRRLKGLNFNTSVFDDPVLQILGRKAEPLTKNPPTGRVNPFAPF